MKVQKFMTEKGERYIVLDENYVIVESIKEYLKYLDLVEKSQDTIKNYAHHLALYCDYLHLINMDILDINTTSNYNALDILAGFVYWLRYGFLYDDNVISVNEIRTGKTVNTIVNLVLRFYEYLSVKGRLNELEVYKSQRKNNEFKNLLYEMNVNRQKRSSLLKIKENEKPLKYITREQYTQLINTCNLRRDKIIIALLFEGGLRIGEALGLQIEDIKPRQNRIFLVSRNLINNVHVKNDSVGSIILPKYVFDWIRDYLIEDISEYDSNFLFLNLYGDTKGQPMQKRTVNDLFERLTKKIGYHVNPHMCRHGYGTERQEAGWTLKEIQHMLRHKTIQTTAIYASVSEELAMQKTVEFYKSKGIMLGGINND